MYKLVGGGGWGERDGQRDRETGRQIDGQRDRERGRQIDRHVGQ